MEPHVCRHCGISEDKTTMYQLYFTRYSDKYCIFVWLCESCHNEKKLYYTEKMNDYLASHPDGESMHTVEMPLDITIDPVSLMSPAENFIISFLKEHLKKKDEIESEKKEGIR